MDNSIKKFKCDRCNKFYNTVIWKKISCNNLYLCENCHKINDIEINLDIYQKLIDLNINNNNI